MKKVRFGLVGYGAWGSHNARALTESPCRGHDRYRNLDDRMTATAGLHHALTRRTLFGRLSPCAAYYRMGKTRWVIAKNWRRSQWTSWAIAVSPSNSGRRAASD